MTTTLTISHRDEEWLVDTTMTLTFGRAADLVLSADDPYLFQPTLSGTYTFTLDADSGYDPVLYVVGECTDILNSCLGAVDDSASGGTETLEVALNAGESYYVIVDGWDISTPENGSYTLSL